ncbi:nucleotidyl transferase AbiEii/AbiGii toxin family protein [Christiangramia echinicola]|uniref:nucleotidyl transferase AbiEii/AbiGii toxin family protein n=1 Tax=Christiangramia echinicola TaxID=279359 RepID=UPI00047DE508|nr:nucleotidyl transferase AbiEii/AbiGii toxin family protein [Christiangramia echinicola]
MKIYRNTVTDTLWKVLNDLMEFRDLEPFRLVGGTSLSLLMGHRKSVDIDLFTDAPYKSLDFSAIESKIEENFSYVQNNSSSLSVVGKSFFAGNSEEDVVKIDLFYTDPFVFPVIVHDSIRLSSIEEIAAMKMEVIGHAGRKKDFWDIHELLEKFSFEDILKFYEKRYPYNYSREELLNKFTDFEHADYDFDPICMKDKTWELIKLDLEDRKAEYLES